jgi:hypothetical protein
MKTTIQNQVMGILDKIPTIKENPHSCRGLEYSEIANELFALIGIDSETIEITEIPLHVHHTELYCNKSLTQFVVIFEKDESFYNMFAGIGNDNNFYFDIMEDDLDPPHQIFTTIEVLQEKIKNFNLIKKEETPTITIILNPR